MSISAPIDISVIIPCRNEIGHVQSCIESALIAGKAFNIELIVVDGKSNDGTHELLKSLEKSMPKIQVIENVKMLTPYAFNMGVKQARGKYICILGARICISENYFKEAIAQLNKENEVGCVGGKIINDFSSPVSKAIAMAMNSPVGVGMGNFRALDKETLVDTVATPVYKKEVMQGVGDFDESLVRNQDDEYNFRLKKRGYKILFLPEISMTYTVRSSFKNLFRQYFQYGYWKVYVNKKHHIITNIRQLFPAMFILALILGIGLAFVHPFFKATLFLGIGSYSMLMVMASFKKAASAGEFFLMLYALLILHFAYGFGYWEGIFNFLVLKKMPSTHHEKLSR